MCLCCLSISVIIASKIRQSFKISDICDLKHVYSSTWDTTYRILVCSFFSSSGFCVCDFFCDLFSSVNRKRQRIFNQTRQSYQVLNTNRMWNSNRELVIYIINTYRFFLCSVQFHSVSTPEKPIIQELQRYLFIHENIYSKHCFTKIETKINSTKCQYLVGEFCVSFAFSNVILIFKTHQWANWILSIGYAVLIDFAWTNKSKRSRKYWIVLSFFIIRFMINFVYLNSWPEFIS